MILIFSGLILGKRIKKPRSNEKIIVRTSVKLSRAKVGGD